MTGGSLWPIRRALEKRGRPTRAVFLGWPHRRLQAYAPRLAAVLEELAAAFPGEPVDAVAHSMGGLVLRLVAARRPDLARRLGRIVTLGTPHGGTGASERLRIGPEVLEMGIDSEFLASLPDFRSTAPQSAVTTVAAVPDLVVYPAANAHLPGARHVGLPGVSHLGLVTDRRAIAVVLDALGAAPASHPER
jgi:triacylglycerol esterase/lipase EstA (alpha/beta hydrolase family)